jgi:hypothetical protein
MQQFVAKTSLLASVSSVARISGDEQLEDLLVDPAFFGFNPGEPRARYGIQVVNDFEGIDPRPLTNLGRIKSCGNGYSSGTRVQEKR